MKPLPRLALPITRLSEHGVEPIPQTGRVGTASQMEMLAIWDRLSDQGRRFVLTMARGKDEEEGPLRRAAEGKA
jgi:hypothetical protein